MNRLIEYSGVLAEKDEEIYRLQEHNLKLIDANVRLSDKVIHLKKECEDKDRVIRAGINTAKRLLAALDEILEMPTGEPDDADAMKQVARNVREALSLKKLTGEDA